MSVHWEDLLEHDVRQMFPSSDGPHKFRPGNRKMDYNLEDFLNM